VPEQDSLPPWADLPPARPARAGRASVDDGETPPDARAEPATGPRTPPGGRALRAAARKRRRLLILIAVLVVVAGGITAAVLLPGTTGPASVTPDGLITTFQPGELQTVPNACQALPAATIQHYLPGQAKMASPLQVGAAESACNWTIDQPPVYRLLQLDLHAYAPNGLASGNGSATRAAIDAYTTAEQDLRDPPKNSAEPRATVATLTGMGNEAFSAAQVFQRGGAVTDVATVVVRYHNVIVTVTLNGLDHSNRGSYGPVSAADLTSAAQAFAQSAEATLH